MSRAVTPSTVGDQITSLLTGFLLTTAARELVSRFIEAEQQPVLLEVLDHHSVLLEFDVPSFRTEQAKRRGKASTSRAEAAS